jgi:hypothetical protein
MTELGANYLQFAVDGFGWFTSLSAYALIPMLIPVLIVGAAATFHGFEAPPCTLSEIAKRIMRAFALFVVLLLAIHGLWMILLLYGPTGPGILILAMPTVIVFPLVACWLFGLAWRLGYDVGLVSAHIHAARWRSRRRAQ